MGAWGSGLFDNDDALDWCYSLAEVSPAERQDYLRSSLLAAINFEGLLPDDLGQETLAALALIVLHGRRDSALLHLDAVPEEVSLLDPVKIDNELMALGVRALDRVEGQGSQLRLLLEESDWWDDVQVVTRKLRGALTSQIAPDQ